MILFCADNHYRRARSSPQGEPKINKQGEPKINKEAKKENGSGNHISAQSFTFRELASITRNFRQENLIGEGGFGRVYRGRLEKTNQVRQ